LPCYFLLSRQTAGARLGLKALVAALETPEIGTADVGWSIISSQEALRSVGAHASVGIFIVPINEKQ
jgi:hypothetical protein